MLNIKQYWVVLEESRLTHTLTQQICNQRRCQQNRKFFLTFKRHSHLQPRQIRSPISPSSGTIRAPLLKNFSRWFMIKSGNKKAVVFYANQIVIWSIFMAYFSEVSWRQSENCMKMKRNKKRFGSIMYFFVHLLINDKQLSLRSSWRWK